MTNKQEIEKRLDEINELISQKQQEMLSLREEGLKLIGKTELLEEQAGRKDIEVSSPSGI
jgi:uncharacterized protein YoxC